MGMSAYQLTGFVTVYALAAASPGPGVAAILARALADGTRSAPPFIAGFVVGDLAWFGLTIAGLAVLAQTAGPLFVIVRYAGAAYLLYLAWQLWTRATAPVDVLAVAIPEPRWRVFLSGLSLTLGNPKAMVFYLAILPALVQVDRLDPIGALQIAAVVVLVLPLVLGSYAIAAARARRLFRDATSLRWLNRGLGTLLAAAALGVALQ